MTPLELYNDWKEKKAGLWRLMVAKYPDRDYELQFQLMCDWYLAKKKRLPLMFSAFMNWMDKTQIDTGLRAARISEMNKASEKAARDKEKDIPPPRPETMQKLRDQISNFKKNGVKSI